VAAQVHADVGALDVGAAGHLGDVAVGLLVEPGEVVVLEAVEDLLLGVAEGGGGARAGGGGRGGEHQRSEVGVDLDGPPLVGEREGRGDRVAELADVAGPVVALEACDGGGRYALEGVGGAKVREHVADQGGDVVEASAEGGEVNPDLGHTEEEVAAEEALVDLAGEVAAGGGDDADVDGAVGVAADGLDAALGEDAEELGLEVDGELAELVEEDGAAVGLDEGGDAAVDGAGEGTFFVAEEGCLGEAWGDGAAVDDDDGASGAGGSLVDGAGDELLAGAGLTADEDRELGGGDAAEAVEEGAHGGGLADEGAEAPELGDGDGLAGGGLEDHLGGGDAEGGALGEADLADPDAAEEGAVLAAFVPEADALLGGDQLGVDGGDPWVVEDDLAILVAPQEDRLVADREPLGGLCGEEDGPSEHLQAGGRRDGGLLGRDAGWYFLHQGAPSYQRRGGPEVTNCCRAAPLHPRSNPGKLAGPWARISRMWLSSGAVLEGLRPHERCARPG
jgi:hypothetical protein